MRDTLLALPGWVSCWETVAVAVAAAVVGVTWDTLMVLVNLYTMDTLMVLVNLYTMDTLMVLVRLYTMNTQIRSLDLIC